mgnify:CR=1 FL=1
MGTNLREGKFFYVLDVFDIKCNLLSFATGTDSQVENENFTEKSSFFHCFK